MESFRLLACTRDKRFPDPVQHAKLQSLSDAITEVTELSDADQETVGVGRLVAINAAVAGSITTARGPIVRFFGRSEFIDVESAEGPRERVLQPGTVSERHRCEPDRTTVGRQASGRYTRKSA
jgi:hypothetical protein